MTHPAAVNASAGEILLNDPSSDGTDIDEEVEDCISQFLSHPFPNPINLSDEEAQRTSPFKLSYTRYLILNKKWESTKSLRWAAPGLQKLNF